ncbi:TetR family transcriptional regulator [Allostreptomyces psammosilenae]|uniref:AcrR family transcriptional regulator n=1 Tax=Allostreptomyces psammosilenae TaxID=1892865 RepID=A0A852ZVQ4_9ACTN|nr:TetR family transcriptional regulator [Allostreptomyces psammosilenae]NYI05330.1 AcrR family transcriptional regulator [Allostreptomyces psammosilenae]
MSSGGGAGGGGLRERTRRAVRAELAELALGMFLERGFDETTVDDIARAAGLSKRSFFRYFPTKEDAVLGEVDDLGQQVVDDLRARPADEDPWESLRIVLCRWEGRIQRSRLELASLRLIESTPSLRAGLHHRRERVRERVSEALRHRSGREEDAGHGAAGAGAGGGASAGSGGAGGAGDGARAGDRPGLDAFTADLLTSAAGTALEVASREWLRSGGTADRAALTDRAFALLRPALVDRR